MKRLHIVREFASPGSRNSYRRRITVTIPEGKSRPKEYKANSEFISDGEVQDDPNFEGYSEQVYETLAKIVESLDALDEYAFSTAQMDFSTTSPASSTVDATRVSRDHFDVLRDLDALLAELAEHFHKINDPNRITNDMRYVRASAEAMREFIEAFEGNDHVEMPTELPRNLLDRLRTIDLTKVDGLTGTVQRIADIISKLFL